MVELDVYVFKTRELVVIHDETVDRTTNGRGSIIDISFEEIRSLDAGDGEQIPTLEEVLDLMRGTRVNIELKGPGTAEPVVAVIADYVHNKGWSYDDFSVSSFNHSR